MVPDSLANRREEKKGKKKKKKGKSGGDVRRWAWSCLLAEGRRGEVGGRKKRGDGRSDPCRLKKKAEGGRKGKKKVPPGRRHSFSGSSERRGRKKIK